MNAADVPDELVEKAARAIHTDICCPLDPDSGCTERDDLHRERHHSRHALAAVLPDIQAQALEEGVEYLAEVHADLDESAGLTSAMGHLGHLADRKRSEVAGA